MRTRSKFLMAGIAAALLMSLAVGTASAGRLSVSNNRFRVTWNPLTIEPGNVRCNLTIEGSFHSGTIQKRVDALLGYVTRAIVAPPAQCMNGEATIDQEHLPWHVRYRGFTGRLPTPSGVVVGFIRAKLRVHINSLGATCEVETTPERPAIGIAEMNMSGTINPFRAEENARIPLAGFCAPFGLEGSFAGSGLFTLLNASTGVVIRLI